MLLRGPKYMHWFKIAFNQIHSNNSRIVNKLKFIVGLTQVGNQLLMIINGN